MPMRPVPFAIRRRSAQQAIRQPPAIAWPLTAATTGRGKKNILTNALLSAGKTGRALEAAEESVALALQRGNQAILPMSYRVLGEALLASERRSKVAAAIAALEKAMAAVDATGGRAEVPFIEHAHQKATSAG